MPATLVIRSLDDLRRLNARLADTDGVLGEIAGTILVRQSQRAFAEQRFGAFSWPPRYFGQGTPFINIAGALEDLKSGPRVKERRFAKRPALMDTGSLLNSLTWNVLPGDSVEYGSPMQYAGKHQEGGLESMPITAAMKANLSRWLNTRKGKPYRSRMSRFLGEQSYDFQVIQRPFVGFTEQGSRDIVDTIEEWAAGE